MAKMCVFNVSFLMGILPGSWVLLCLFTNYCFMDPCADTTKATVLLSLSLSLSVFFVLLQAQA